MPTSSKKVRCLLIRLRDGRTFLTHEDNRPALLEFALVTGARLKAVRAWDPPLLSLRELVTRICDLNYPSDTTRCEHIERKQSLA